MYVYVLSIVWCRILNLDMYFMLKLLLGKIFVKRDVVYLSGLESVVSLFGGYVLGIGNILLEYIRSVMNLVVVRCLFYFIYDVKVKYKVFFVGVLIIFFY